MTCLKFIEWFGKQPWFHMHGLPLETPYKSSVSMLCAGGKQLGSSSLSFIIFGSKVWKQCESPACCAYFIIIILVMALTPRHGPLLTHCPWNTLLRKLLLRASLDSGLLRWIPRGLIACLPWGNGGVGVSPSQCLSLSLFCHRKNAINK